MSCKELEERLEVALKVASETFKMILKAMKGP
jgi:hypothetical protein